jgi:hypothetical protein
VTISTPTSLLVNGSGTDLTLYTTASVTPSASALLLLFVTNAAGVAGDNVKPTIAGTLGLTWTEIVTGTQLANTLRGTLWWAKTTGSPPTGTVSMTFSTTQSSCQWHITQILNADLTTPIVQSGLFQTATTDNPAVTLASAIGSGNATLGFNVWNTSTALPVGAGYTELSVSPSATTPTVISSVEYLVAGSTTVDWTTTSNVEKCIFGIEVADAPPAVGNTTNFFQFV